MKRHSVCIHYVLILCMHRQDHFIKKLCELSPAESQYTRPLYFFRCRGLDSCTYLEHTAFERVIVLATPYKLVCVLSLSKPSRHISFPCRCLRILQCIFKIILFCSTSLLSISVSIFQQNTLSRIISTLIFFPHLLTKHSFLLSLFLTNVNKANFTKAF